MHYFKFLKKYNLVSKEGKLLKVIEPAPIYLLSSKQQRVDHKANSQAEPKIY